jgi:predicted secreted protein
MNNAESRPIEAANQYFRKSSHWQVLTRLPDGREISTVKLPFGLYGWETRIFDAGDSNVVGTYALQEEAIKGHVFIVQHELMHDLFGSVA